MNYRRGLLVGSSFVAAVLLTASAAFACVTFKGQMLVDGHDGDTTVVGTGNSHGYCSAPTSAARGHLADSITATVSSATCNGTSHSLPDKTYEVRYNNKKAYNSNGTTWTMISGTGCWATGNSTTVSVLGTMTVSGGSGTWTGTLGDPKGTDYYPGLLEAANFCVGDGTNGLLAPYQLLLV